MLKRITPLPLALLLITVPGCGSTADEGTPEPPKNVLACSQPAVCGIVASNSGGPGFPLPTAYTSAQLCALQELAKGEPVRIHYNDGCEGQCFGKVLLVRSDASVIVQPYSEAFGEGVDLDGMKVEFNDFAQSELCTLKPPSYFEKCMEAFDAWCTSSLDWVADCAEPAPASCEP